MKKADHHRGAPGRQLAGNPHHSRGPHTIRATGAGDKSCSYRGNAGGYKGARIGGGTTKRGRSRR